MNRDLIKFSFLIACLLLERSIFPRNHNDSLDIAVFGGRASVGAGAHPALEYDVDFFWDLFKGQRELEEKKEEDYQNFGLTRLSGNVQILNKSEREYYQSYYIESLLGLKWIFDQFKSEFFNQFFNYPKYSMAYYFSQYLSQLKQRDPQVYYAGQIGEGVSQFPLQVDRLLDAKDGELPEVIFVQFSGDDLCAHRFDLMTGSQLYESDLVKGLSYLVNNAQMKKNSESPETKIFVLSELNMSQFIASEKIAQKKVMVHSGKLMTCRELREKNFMPKNENQRKDARHWESLLTLQVFPPNPALYCPTLQSMPFIAQKRESNNLKGELATPLSKSYSQMLTDVASMARKYREAASRAVRTVQDKKAYLFPKKNISLHYVDITADLIFEEDELASDCFNLNWKGQLKIARSVFDQIKNQI